MVVFLGSQSEKKSKAQTVSFESIVLLLVSLYLTQPAVVHIAKAGPHRHNEWKACHTVDAGHVHKLHARLSGRPRYSGATLRDFEALARG